MNFLETLALTLITSAEETVPAFVHSKNGIFVVNASENFINNLFTALSKKTAASPTPAV